MMPSLGNRLRVEDIGGASVLRPFRVGDTLKKRGDKLTRDEVLSLRPNNREALINNGFLREWMQNDGASSERYVSRRKDLKYDVVAGHPINDVPLSRDEAEYLARSASAGG